MHTTKTHDKLLAFTGDGVCVHTFDDGRILQVNQGFVDILELGCRPEDLVGKLLRDIMTCDGEDAARRVLESDGELHGVECDIKTLKGVEKRLVRDSLLTIDPATNQRVVECLVRDVSTTKRADRILHALLYGTAGALGEDFFKSLVVELASALQMNCAFIGKLEPVHQQRIQTIAVCIDGKLVDNLEYDVEGSPCQTVVGRSLHWYPRDVQKSFPRDKLLVEMGAVGYAGVPLFSASGDPLGVLAVIHTQPIQESDDVKSILTIFAARAAAEIEREQAKEILRESEMRYKRLLASVTDYVYTVTIANGQPVSTTHGRNCEAVTGYTPEEYASDPTLWYRMIYEEDRPAVTACVTRILTERSALTFEHRLMHKNGAIRWVRTTLVPRHNEREVLIAYDGIVTDITERKLAEQELLRLAAAVNAADESIIITDLEGNIKYVNPCFEQMTGYTRGEIVGKNTRCLKSGKHNTAFYNALWSTISSGVTWHGHFTNRKKDGTLFEEEATISPVRDSSGKISNYVAVKRDVTQEVMLENELRHSQKMDAIGRLASGVAHDFTNMLVVILNYAEIVKSNLPPDAPEQSHMDSIIEAANRSGKLSGQLLAFAHRQPILLRVTDLNKIVKNMEDMMRRSIRSDINLTIHRTNEKLMVKADSAQLEQIIVHMIVNAQDAMPDRGQITMEVSRAIFSKAEAVQLQDWAHERVGMAGSFAAISISDTGCGMTAEVKRRAFDPFFTTKGAGTSTGLGLSTCYGIIKQHGGLITVYTNEGLGSTFTIYLPLVDQPEPDIDEGEPIPAELRGTETILVTEDDALVRKVLVGMLQRLGYSVQEAEDGNHALEIARHTTAVIHMLLSDTAMPEMTGSTLADTLRKMRPGIKVLLGSGYPKYHLKEQGIFKEEYAFINKPYFLGTLARSVREVLSKPQAD